MRNPVPEAAESAQLSEHCFARLAEFITSELGFKMPVSKLTMVQSRLMRRVRELRLDSVRLYCEILFTDDGAEEREHFINAITTNKTHFFREPEHLDYLIDIALPALFSRNAVNDPVLLKVWSAGCSSGEEPYTLAMVLSDYAAGRPAFDFAILATDVSTKVLEMAQDGVYPESQITPIPPEMRRKYMLRSKDGSRKQARVVPRLRECVSIHQLNFMEEDYDIRDMFEVIFFRNVLIYFDRPTQEAVVRKMCRNLAPGGYLFVGQSETLAGLDVPVQPTRNSVYRMPLSLR